MAKYHLRLTGYVGGSDFNSKAVSKYLTDHADDDVNVLIDSTGGDLATALSIAAAFKNHGAVNVHFVGFNASAATVAALGAASVSIDRAAMFLVHKCSNLVFAWSSMNADELDAYIADLVKNKLDLNKIDDNIAAMYAARCKKKTEDLIALMAEGRWLNAKDALDWGFVDKITDLEEDDEPRLTASLANDLKAAGIPVPQMPKAKSSIEKIFDSIKEFFTADSADPKTLEDSTPLSSVQPVVANAAESLPENRNTEQPAADTVQNDSSPADSTDNVVNSSESKLQSGDILADYLESAANAHKLFNSIP